MKKLLYLIVGSILIFSCHDSKIKIKDSTLAMLSEGDFVLPSKHGSFNLFFRSENGEVGCTYVDVLHYIFITYYSKSYKNFNLFLAEVLNQKIKISKEKFNRRQVFYFTLDNSTKKDYDTLSFDVFFAKYCQKSRYSADEYYLVRKYRKSDNIFTIMYFLFINNYWISSDDLIGDFIISNKPYENTP